MDIKHKRYLSYFTLALFQIFSGIEYAVIFPTIWAYLQQLGTSDETFLGICVAAYSFSAMLTQPFVGYWYDKTHNAKMILIMLNLFEIAGSVMYFFGISPWFIILSRLVCGIGGGTSAAVMADLSLATSNKDRTSVLANIIACRQLGLLIGPAFNLILREINFSIGPFPVNEKTVPGIFMALVWTVLEILFCTTYFNLGTLSERERLQESLRHNSCSEYPSTTRYGAINFYEPLEHPTMADETISSNHSISGDGDDEDFDVQSCTATYQNQQPVYSQMVKPPSREHLTSCGEMIEDAERVISSLSEFSNSNSGRIREEEVNSPLLAQKEKNTNMVSVCAHTQEGNAGEELSFSKEITNYKSWSIILNVFISEELVALIALTFMAMFAQSSLETIATPMLQLYYNFGNFENSLFFLVAGILILLVFILLGCINKCISDRTLILVGCIMLLFSLIWYLTFVPWMPKADRSSLPLFIVGVTFNVSALPFLFTCSASLFSKVIKKDLMGFGHGVRRSFASLGLILGPLWGGSVAHYPIILFAVPLALMGLILIMLLLSFSYLVPLEDRANELTVEAIS